MEVDSLSSKAGAAPTATSEDSTAPAANDKVKDSTLRQEVLDLIAPYNERDSPPVPFTTAELVVIAIIALQKPEATQRDIFFFIISNFRQLAQRTLHAYAHRAFRNSSIHRPYDEVLDGFGAAFEQYEVPVRQVLPPEEIDENGWAHLPMWSDGPRWAVDVNAARVLLRKHLDGGERGTFRFLDLPGELRTSIYEYLLWYPSLIIRNEWDETTAHAQVHYDSESKDVRLINDLLKVNTLDDILAIARVNKQTYREALPIFYSINTFELGSESMLRSVVRTLSAYSSQIVPDRHALCANEPVRLSCIRSIQIDRFDETGVSEERSRLLFEDLRSLKGLKHLSVGIYENSFDNGWGDPVIFLDPTYLPGMPMLVDFLRNIDSYELTGDCDKYRKYVAAELTKSKV